MEMNLKRLPMKTNNRNDIEFFATPNSWINNGLITLVQKLQNEFESQVNIEFSPEKIKINSTGNLKIDELLCKALHNTAADGTYNFSTSLKFLNQKLKSGYSSPKSYPDSEDDFSKTIEITIEEKDFLKKEKKEMNPLKKQQLWKQRLSFFSNKKNYLDRGLNLKDDKKFSQVVFNNGDKEICPFCGGKTEKMINIQQQFNPLTSEHHNNEIEGFSFVQMGRKNSQVCYKCVLLCYFALFNKNIPFFQVPQKDTYLAIPNVIDLEILRKVNNNLSLPRQSINFGDATCASYSSNIKSLFYRSKNACLLALLHNIKNEYSKTEPEKLTLFFEEITREEFSEVIEWLFISKSFRITHIRADEKVYDILEKFKDPQNNESVYLVTDFLANFSFYGFDDNIIDKFFEGILKFNLKYISYGLFHMAKVSVEKSNEMYQRFRSGGNPPLLLFEKIFLPKILEVGKMLDKKLSEACIDVAKSIGRSFSDNVGMMTQFAYASGPEEFKKAIEDALFRLAKQSTLEKGESIYVSEESLKILFDSLNPDEFSDIKNYFVSFMSVAAITKNYAKSKKEG